jgi:transcriptional regulator with XRE-family HTH domain
MGATNPASLRNRHRQRTITIDGPHPIDIHVGARIRAQRVANGLTQSELAKLVGISFQSVQKYEQGENRVSASRLYEFAEALGVAPQHFFDGLGARKNKNAAAEAAMPMPTTANGELQRNLLAVMAIEDERLRRLVVQLLRVLSEIGGVKAGGGSPAVSY